MASHVQQSRLHDQQQQTALAEMKPKQLEFVLLSRHALSAGSSAGLLVKHSCILPGQWQFNCALMPSSAEVIMQYNYALYCQEIRQYGTTSTPRTTVCRAARTAGSTWHSIMILQTIKR